MSFKVFITGTDTDVGKTIISASIVYAFNSTGMKYWKPVQTGYPDEDRKIVNQLAPVSKCLPTPFIYDLPASPDQAAAHENKTAPSLAQLQAMTAELDQSSVLIEGAGGLKVPLNEQNETWLDYLKAMRLPVILVARTGLGTLNHTSMTLDLLNLHDVPVLAVILNGEEHEANKLSLERMYPTQNFIHFPKCDLDDEMAWRFHAQNLGEKLAPLFKPVPRDDETLTADRDHCWHPYTQHKVMERPVHITKAKGPWLYTSDDKALLDGTSSWWSNTIGHGRPEIAEAIHQQQQRVDHIIFAGATHEGAAKLAKRLSKLSKDRLPRVFFSDNGSCAVEIAMKMAIQQFVNRGIEGRHKFITLKGAYHGDTFGAMSASGTEGFHGAFAEFMFDTIEVKPVTEHPSHLCPEGKVACDEELAKLEKIFMEESESLAGVIIEPFIQGASGMNMQHLPWLEALCKLAKRWQVPLIFDEVFTGLGRCGDPFAFLRFHLDPDLVCIAKGLTGGNLPLAVTMAKENIFRNFYDDDRSKALYHGHTYTANAICCAAANATLDIYEKEQLFSRSRNIESHFNSWILKHAEELGLVNPRTVGAILAWELPNTGLGDYFNEKARSIPSLAREFGLFLRPLGNTIYLLPALTISPQDLDFALEGIRLMMKKFNTL